MKYTIICKKCGEKTTSEIFGTRCNSCNSTDVYITEITISGEDMVNDISKKQSKKKDKESLEFWRRLGLKDEQ